LARKRQEEKKSEEQRLLELLEKTNEDVSLNAIRAYMRQHDRNSFQDANLTIQAGEE
jgi:uncharacterized protein YehS (DUF1456 family)